MGCENNLFHEINALSSISVFHTLMKCIFPTISIFTLRGSALKLPSMLGENALKFVNKVEYG